MSYTPLTPEQRALAERFRHYVRWVARNHFPGIHPNRLDDALQAGAVGLVIAAARHDGRAEGFARYACSYIRQAIGTHLRRERARGVAVFPERGGPRTQSLYAPGWDSPPWHELAAPADDTEERLATAAAAAELVARFDALPADERAAVEAVYVEGLTFLQAGAKLGCPYQSVQRRVGRAVRRLRGGGAAELVGGFDRLSPDERAAVEGVCLRGDSHDQVAARLGVSRRMVGALIGQAVERIRGDRVPYSQVRSSGRRRKGVAA